MANDFIRVSEIEIIPIIERIGAELIIKKTDEITFLYKNIILSIYLEREFEVYGVVSSLKTKQSVYFSELLSDYLNVKDNAVFHLSESFPMETCLKKIVYIIMTNIFPLIVDGRIFEAMDIIMLKREESLGKYYEGLVEKEAKIAFREKKYEDVISRYAEISELNDVQKKRLKISKGKVKCQGDGTPDTMR